MNFPDNLKYTKSHEWILFTGEKTAKVGLTEYAANALGSVVFVDPFRPGDAVIAGESMGDVESVKSVSEIVSPFTGEIAAVNDEVVDSPGRLNDDAYGSWLVEISQIDGRVQLLDAAEYKALYGEGR